MQYTKLDAVQSMRAIEARRRRVAALAYMMLVLQVATHLDLKGDAV